MNIALRRPFTVEEYLAWSNTQTERQRSELINGQIVAMAPERIKHAKAKLAVAMALKAAVVRSGFPCHVLADGPTVRIDDHTAYEPDALVYCGQELPGDALVVPNPLIIVEVLSPTTMHTDTSAKLIGYFKLPSVQHYLIIDPDACMIVHHARAVDGTISANKVTSGPVRLDPPGLSIDIADIFD